MRFRDQREQKTWPGWVGVLLLSWLVTGCNTVGYYTQAVKGHCQIVARRESCKKLIANPATSPELKARLELAREICTFADYELGLASHGAYQRYADLERPYVVWNVYAAPEFSLEARTWWYPFVGSLDYRGYFDEDVARQYAGRLSRHGEDVYVEGVEAYSTLGWFKDPLLNTFLYHSQPILAEVLFHELAHQRVFASGDTDFNEAFATVVAKEGVRRWLKSRGDTNSLADYEATVKHNDAFVRIVQAARGELKELYGSSASADTMEAGKAGILDELRDNFHELLGQSEQFAGYEPWFADGLNNAKLNSVATYYDLVPAFDELLARNQGNLDQFYKAVKELTKLSESERHRELTGRGNSTFDVSTF